jgi:hypothetical protein
MLCKAMRDDYDLIAITNDIYTKEDQRLLTVSGALPAERILGVETGGCPHTAIREELLHQPGSHRPHAGRGFPTPTSCLWKAAATTWLPPSAPSSRT